MATDEQNNKNIAEREALLEYICHPAKRNSKITLLTSIVIVVCIVLTYFITYSVFMTILGGVILIGALTGFYFPTRYTFYDDYFLVKSTTQTIKKEWTLFRSYYPDKNGILLSPFGRPTRLENFRGVFVRFENNREEVIALVKSKIDFEDDE